MPIGRKEIVPHADFDALADPENKESPETLGSNAQVREPAAREHSTNSPRRLKTPKRRGNSTARCGRRLMRRYHFWKSAHMYLGRYSIEKMIAFEEYQRLASPLRVFAVVALTPLPALIVVLLLAAIPLQSPLLSATENPAYFIQSWLSFSVVTFGMLLYMRCALALPLSVYSHQQCALISVLTSGANELVMFVVSVIWRFPIPLRDYLGAPSYTVFFILFHVLILRGKLSHFYYRIREYLPLYFAQVSTFFVFEGVAILFSNSPVSVKTFITISYPMLRAVLRRIVRSFSHSLEDISTETTICVIEIFGSFFQNVCLQSACSMSLSGFIILVDFSLAILEVWLYLDHKFVVDGRSTTRTAIKIIEHAFFPGSLRSRTAKRSGNEGDRTIGNISSRGVSVAISVTEISQTSKKITARSSSRSTRASTRTLTRMSTRSIRRPISKVACSPEKSVDVGSIDLGVTEASQVPAIMQSSTTSLASLATVTPRARQSSIDDTDIVHRHHVKLLSQTLQLVFASEVLIFAEYSEVACAFIYGVYSLTVYHMHNSKYIVPFIGLHKDEFWASITNSAVYTVLEGCTVIFLFVLVRAKFGFSTLYQLAFVLEKYWMSVQGKIVGSFTLIFVLNTVHQGTDLSLKFKWGQIMKGSPCLQ